MQIDGFPSGIIKKHEFETSFRKREELNRIVIIFFKFVYYLGLSPFCFVIDRNGQTSYSRRTSISHRVICAFLHLLLLFRLVGELRLAFHAQELAALKNNPKAYFRIVQRISVFMYHLITCKRLWWNSKEFLGVLNAILKTKYLPLRTTWITKPTVLYMAYGLFVLKAMLNLIGGYTFVTPLSIWSPKEWVIGLVKQGKFVFCFHPNSTPAPKWERISAVDGILAFLMFFGYYMRFVLGEFEDICLLAFALTMLTTAKAFAADIEDKLRPHDEEEFPDSKVDGKLHSIHSSVTMFEIKSIKGIHESPRISWSKISRSLIALQEVSKAVNSAVGSQFTFYVVQGLLFYSIHINALFIAEDMSARVNWLSFFVVNISAFYIAAKISTQMKPIEAWLETDDNMKTVPIDEVHMVLHKMCGKDIGIRGYDMFTITFSFLGGVSVDIMLQYISLMVTFFIICIQFS